MLNCIRIGTRKSPLALWQATVVRHKLEDLGHKTEICPIQSTGDLILNKPIYELGITGIFTKTLDIALLNNDIDIAVHSLKDVPTTLPKGIIQAAVLKRGNVKDTLIFKKNEEFLSQREAVIATGSLRRKAQWLNRYPSHTVVNLRGNVNTRLHKLKTTQSWNAALFAAAGLGRLGIKPQEAINLDWMIPAPAQGAIMIAALDKAKDIKAICHELNHEETQICTSIEREFLNRLEGGCSAPIGALAIIKDERIHFKGILLNNDGTKKIEASYDQPLNKHHNIAQHCANYIIERGGKRLMNTLKKNHNTANIYSTKKLTAVHKQQFHNSIVSDSSDFIQISFNRIKPSSILNPKPKNVIITSKNTVESLITNFSSDILQFENIYCVGRRTKRLIEQKIGPVKHSEQSAEKLAHYLVEYIEGTEATFFCSNLRLDDLPKILRTNHIDVTEIETYTTKLNPVKVDNQIKGVMFYSPSTVKSYILKNEANGIAFCIGTTTAKEAKKYFKHIKIAKIPTVESVIEAVNKHFIQEENVAVKTKHK